MEKCRGKRSKVKHHGSVYSELQSQVLSRNGVIEIEETVRNNTTMLQNSRGSKGANPPRNEGHGSATNAGN
eukprot:6226828-Heterocapsa_arctica.AAC.1